MCHIGLLLDTIFIILRFSGWLAANMVTANMFIINLISKYTKFRNFMVNKAGSFSSSFIFLTIILVYYIHFNIGYLIWFFDFVNSACVTYGYQKLTGKIRTNTKRAKICTYSAAIFWIFW